MRPQDAPRKGRPDAVVNGDKKLVGMLYDRELIRAFCKEEPE